MKTLLVFCKEPVAGKVKTRLCPPLTHEEARDLYNAFLRDSFCQYSRLAKKSGWRIQLAVTPNTSITFFQNFWNELNLNTDVEIITQGEGDLGMRMYRRMDEHVSKNNHVAVIGTDHPSLPDEYVTGLFDGLDEFDVTIGPAEDGGYYAMGLKRIDQTLFSNIAWSTSSVFDQTMKAIKKSGLTVSVLPTWYDVDDEKALQRLISELELIQVSYTKMTLNEFRVNV